MGMEWMTDLLDRVWVGSLILWGVSSALLGVLLGWKLRGREVRAIRARLRLTHISLRKMQVELAEWVRVNGQGARPKPQGLNGEGLIEERGDLEKPGVKKYRYPETWGEVGGGIGRGGVVVRTEAEKLAGPCKICGHTIYQMFNCFREGCEDHGKHMHWHCVEDQATKARMKEEARLGLVHGGICTMGGCMPTRTELGELGELGIEEAGGHAG